MSLAFRGAICSICHPHGQSVKTACAKTPFVSIFHHLELPNRGEILVGAQVQARTAPDFRTADPRASCWERLLSSASGEESGESRGIWDHFSSELGWTVGYRCEKKGGWTSGGRPYSPPALCLLQLLLQREPTGATASRKRKGFGLRVGELCQLASRVSSAR